MDDHNSIGTCQTGLTNATTKIPEEAVSTKFGKVIEIDDYTVTSGIMEPTVYTPPQQPKDSSVNSEDQLAPMNLEGQKGEEDDMDLESNDKKNGNQNEETKGKNQELQAFETPTNINSPCLDVVMAAEVIHNGQGGDDCQINENDHDNDKQKEERGGGSDDK